MADYKVIYKEEAAGWQQGCPILIEAIQVSRNTETAQCYLQLKVRNVSDAKVSKLVVACSVDGPDGIESQRFECLDADIQPSCIYKPAARLLESREVTSVTAKVLGEDGSDAYAEMSALPEATEASLPAAMAEEKAKRLMELGLNEHLANFALKHKAAQFDTWRQCACGAVNVGDGKCWQCHASQGDMAGLDEIDTLEKSAQARAVAEAQKAETKAKNIKTGKRVGVIAAICVVAIAALVSGYNAFVKPNFAGTHQEAWVVSKATYYDDSQRKTYTTEYTLDANGNPTKDLTTYETAYKYYDAKEPTSAYTFTYDDKGFETSRKGKYSSSRAINERDSYGQPTKVTITDSDGDKETYTFAYYGEGKLKSQGNDDPSIGWKSTSLYNEDGWRYEYNSSWKSSSGNTNSRSTYTFTTADGKVTEWKETNSDKKTTAYTFEYDSDGNISKVYENGKLYREYEYTKVSNASLGAILRAKSYPWYNANL